MHEFHAYNPDLPQIITSFKGNQKLILGGFRYNIHHIKEGVKTWRCVCAKKLTGTRSWCKGRAETWDNDSKGIPKGEHNHSTEHELAELEFFKSQMILAAISEPTADLSTLIDEAAKFLSEGLNFGNRESMKKSLLVARKSVESGEFNLGKHRTISSGGQQRSLSSSTGKKKGAGGGGTTAHQSGKSAAAISAPKGTVASKSVPVSSLLSVSAVPMPSSSKFPSPSSFKCSAASSTDGIATSFDTSGAASCSNTSGYGTLSSSGLADEDSATHGIGWMDLSGETGNFLTSTQHHSHANNAPTGMNGGSANANLLGVEGNPSSSSTDQQQLLAAALFAAAMLGNPSPTPSTTIAETFSTTLGNSNSNTTGGFQQHQHTVGEMMMSMMMPSSNNNKSTKRGSARSSATAAAAVAGVGAVQAKQQREPSQTATANGTLTNSRNAAINARKKTARVNCILNKLSTKAAEKSVSPSPSSNNSESSSVAKVADSVDSEQKDTETQREKQLVTVATQTDRDMVANEDEELKGTRKRKSDENAPFGRAKQQNGNEKEGTEKRKVLCCCCCEESELNGLEMPLGCKRRVLKTEQNGTTTKQQQMSKQEEEEEMVEQESDLEEELFENDHEIKLEIAEEEEEHPQKKKGSKGEDL
ncbi:hypothetical protein niasHS_005633 [Heterodera schachtii]|uniref:FLYWCH-type domain-containing protein n=1 Tax=Heterodera schachtii TaxID=97005 RepID=A0ABD2JZR3_HETSC